MTNLIEKIVGTILTATPIILLLIKLFAAEYVTQFTKKLFNSKTNKKANLIFNGIVVFLLILGILIFLSSNIEKETNQDLNLPEQQEISTQKSDAEVILEGTNIAYNEIKKGIENKKTKNNEIFESREKRMVYQIGDIKDNEKSIMNLYNSLKRLPSFDISRIYVFKIKKNAYFLYKEGLSESQLSDSSLTSFKDQIDSVEHYVKIIDLMTNCKLKETITETNSFKSRKEKNEIRCFNCDKIK